VKVANGLTRRGHTVRLLTYKTRSLTETMRRRWLALRYPYGNDWASLFLGRLESFRDISRCHFTPGEIVVASGGWAAKELRRVVDPRIIKIHHIRGIDGDDDLMRDCWAEDVPKIAVASYLGPVVERILGQKLTAVVPNGIDADEYYPVTGEQPRDGVGAILGVSWHKDPETIIQVAARLTERRPGLPIRIFGARRRASAIPRHIYSRLPTLEQVRSIYSRSLVWFLGSRSEGFPAPVLEAMACGCAVVATDCGGPRDIIQDGDNGFLVGVGNVDEIVNRVERLLDDTQLRDSFTEKGRATVAQFSWESSIDKMERVLDSVARGIRG
jgi:glycosyltransferase involved in cell wall biosynthesis